MKTKDEDPRVVALIPAWNEAATIGAVIEGVRARLPVLVVDDGSSDGTADVARRSGAIVISHPANLRKGAALKTGFAWALLAGYDAVVTLDADGQHDPADIDKILHSYRSGAGDLVIGERDFSQMPWPNRYSTPLGSRMLSWALGRRVTDNQSGFRLLSRRFLERMKPRTAGYEMEVEMIWEAVRMGMAITWVPIRTIYFPDRKSGFRPFRDTLLFLKMVVRIWLERTRPERAAERKVCAERSVENRESG
jgi:glycosyltransferase involved in cell wall biosynthesis